MLKNFLTEEAEDARNIAGRRPALFAADEDDEVKNLKQGACGAALNAPTKHALNHVTSVSSSLRVSSQS